MSVARSLSGTEIAAQCGYQRIGVIPKAFLPGNKIYFGLARASVGWSFWSWEIGSKTPSEHTARLEFNRAIGWKLDDLRFGLALLTDWVDADGGACQYRVYFANCRELVMPNTTNGSIVDWHWAKPEEMKVLIARGLDFLAGRVGNDEWRLNPGLNPDWALLINSSSMFSANFGWRPVDPDSEFDWS